MHSNKVWLAFLFLLTVGLLWFSVKTVNKFVSYSSLDAKTEVFEMEFISEELAFDKYLLKAKYNFIFQDKVFMGEERLDFTFQNPYAIEKTIEKYKQKSWPVWFSKHHPAYNTLNKHFPLKEGISMIILWGLWGYFIWIGYRVSHWNRNFH